MTEIDTRGEPPALGGCKHSQAVYRDDMGHSIRQTPIIGYAKSDKSSKVATHRKLRRKIHVMARDPAVEVYPDEREVSNTRDWRKSPRGWAKGIAILLPKLMRK